MHDEVQFSLCAIQMCYDVGIKMDLLQNKALVVWSSFVHQVPCVISDVEWIDWWLELSNKVEYSDYPDY